MIFRLVIVFVHLWSLAFASVLSEPPLFQSLGLGSRLRVYRARSPSHPTESSSLPGPREPYVTDWHFAFSCSPRSDYAAAVSCRYSRSDSRLTGTSTPLRCHLHSRTLSSLAGLITNGTATPALKGWAIFGCPYGTRRRHGSQILVALELQLCGAKSLMFN